MASINVAWCGMFFLVDCMSVDLRIDVTVKPRLSGMHLSGNTAIRTVFLGNEKTQRNLAPFNRKSVFPEPDSGLGNLTMFYNDQRSVLSGHAPECH